VWTYIAKRLLQTIPTLLVISLMVFSILYMTPGDPVYLMLGASETQNVDQAVYDAIRKELGLDDPFLVRYFRFLGKAVRGDLGKSYITREDVFQTVMKRMPATLQLTVAALVVAVLVAIPLGVLAALKQNSIWDNIAVFFSTVGVSLPRFWFGLVLIIVFALRLKWLPSYGIGYIDQGLGTVLRHLALPAISLGLSLAALLMRMTRSSMVEVLNQDYVKFARAKGLKERTVILVHALKNALIPVITVLGTQFGALLGGSVVTETIFAWPGVGRLAVNSIARRDFPMIQGNTLIICAGFLFVNLIVDILYTVLDPRITYASKK